MSTAVGPAGRGAAARRAPLPAWALACLGLFACGWGGNQFTPLLTLYRRADGWTAVVVDALLAAYVLGLAPALLLGGRVSDRHGRRRTVLLALGASVAGSGLLATGGLPGVAAGRLCSGAAVGLAMAVGTSWATELTVAAGTPGPAGARRSSLWLTAGFGTGAGAAGLLAQWGPAPETVPYLVHAALALGVLAAVARWAPDTHPERDAGARTLGRRLLAPSVRHRRFAGVVVPAAPWVFGAAALAYAVLPQAMAPHLGHWALVYATGITVASLGCGVAVQPLARRLDDPVSPRAQQVALALVMAGTGLAAGAVAAGDPVIAAVAALVLGAAYGIGLVAGLLEVQRIAPASELAELNGAYYALTYVGFLLPAAMAAATRWVPTAWELLALVGVAGGCAAAVSRARPAT